MSNVSFFIKEKELSLNDVSIFINIIQSIYSEVNRLNTNVSINIKSSDLVDICYIILDICLSMIIISEADYLLISNVLLSAVKLINFTMNKTISFNLKSLLCCRK